MTTMLPSTLLSVSQALEPAQFSSIQKCSANPSVSWMRMTSVVVLTKYRNALTKMEGGISRFSTNVEQSSTLADYKIMKVLRLY